MPVHMVVGVVGVVRDRELREHHQHRVAVRRVGAPVHQRQGVGQRAADTRARFIELVRFGDDALEDRRQHPVERRHRLRREACFGDGPAVDLAVEHRQRAEEEDDDQYVAEHQAEPGVQPRHR